MPNLPKDIIEKLISEASFILLEKNRSVLLALAAFLAKGHLLIEDVPGLGKTTLAVGIAKLLGLDFARIQMTSDLLPGDLIGVSLFDQREHAFKFHKGPIFHSIILADEINRASPRTQSALLEAMAEGQVSTDGVTYRLPLPFFVLATQNPKEESGIFPLPESQMDRFLMKIEIGYPSPGAEKKLLKGEFSIKKTENFLERKDLLLLQETCTDIFLSDEIMDMILALTTKSRNDPMIRLGLSPRGTLALKSSAQAWAMLSMRDYVIPDDLFSVAIPVLSHRLYPASGSNGTETARMLLEQTWGL
jgi:MoxR-like ATPase